MGYRINRETGQKEEIDIPGLVHPNDVVGKKPRVYSSPLNKARLREVACPEQAPVTRLQRLAAMSYEEYLKTPEWQAKRQKALRFAGFRCQVCNSPERLNVHHRTYERRGHELLGDLCTLCNDCHMIFHANGELHED